MTVALLVGLALLTVVVGLSLSQRRLVRDMTGAQPARGQSTPPPRSPGPAALPDERDADDPLATISYDGERTWSTDGCVSLGDWHVVVRFIADDGGPTREHFAWAQRAIDQWVRLERESVALLLDVLAPLDVAPDDLEPATLIIGPIAGEFEGRLEFDTLHDSIERVYVRSTSPDWTDLAPFLETTPRDQSAPVRSMPHPIAGTLEYDGDGMWSTPDRVQLAGREMHIVLLAGDDGPEEEHDEWLRAFMDRGAAVLADADALALTTAPDDMQPAGLGDTIIVVGPDENARFIGGVTYHGAAGRESDQRKVWSRDRWATLSLERG